MYFSKQPLSSHRGLTQAQLGPPLPSIAGAQPTKVAGRKARPYPTRPLPYYEDHYGFANPEENRGADYCESESDDDKDTERSKKRQRPTNEDTNQYMTSEFDFRAYGKRAGPVDLNDEERNDTLVKKRDSANLHDIGARYQQATGFGQFPHHQSAFSLSKPHVNNHEGQHIDPGKAIVSEQEEDLGDLLLFDDKARPTKGQISPGSACPTCGAATDKAKQSAEGKELDISTPTSDSRLLDPLEMNPSSTRQVPKPGSVKAVTNSRRTKNSSVGREEEGFADDLRDINQDYHLLETSNATTERSNEVPAIKKVDVKQKQKQKAKKDVVAGNKGEGTVDGQARYSTRGAELTAQREEEEQRLANRRVTRHIAATASSVPASQPKKKKEYGRGSMTARSAVLSTGKKNRKKRERSLPALKAKVGKQCLRNWRGEVLMLQPGQMIPIVDIGRAQ